MPTIAERFGSLPTGFKLFSIITLALLPLGLIALFASLAATRTADLQRSADLRVALTESTRKLNAELTADIEAMFGASNAIADGMSANEVCARLLTLFTARTRRVSHFAVFGPGSAPLCSSSKFGPVRLSTLDPMGDPVASIKLQTLEVIVPARHGGAFVVARYPPSTLDSLARSPTLATPFSLTLSTKLSALTLRFPSQGFPARPETIAAPVGLMDLSLTISAARIAFSPTEALLTFLPLLMWASAALTGFLVVDRLLIEPLRDLRFAVASHVPGTSFRLPLVRTPAREIEELAQTFAKHFDELSQHEVQLATALADQTRATREVHHRVKNNLQVIASLISLHARGPHSPDAVAAYSAIQRRVDALSIVHRNHYADFEAGGIDIKALLGELATNLRAGASGNVVAPVISISAPPLGVRQDIAVAVAFLLTELVELSMSLEPSASIAMMIEPIDDPAKARLSLTSLALRSSPALAERMAGRYARVIEGLARQLRTPLLHDETAGRFAVDIPVVDTRETF